MPERYGNTRGTDQEYIREDAPEARGDTLPPGERAERQADEAHRYSDWQHDWSLYTPHGDGDGR